MKAPSPAPKGNMVWDAHAPVYEQVWERSTTLWGRDALVLGQLPPTDVSPKPRFLDVACGAGAFAIAAAALGYDVTATDFSAGMVARLDEKVASPASAGLAITTQVVDGQTLDYFKDGSFDVVSSMFGIMLFPDRGAAWRSAWRVLKPGGRLLASSWDIESVNLRLVQYIMEHAADKPGEAIESGMNQALLVNTNRTLEAATFREELEEFGFQDVQIHTTSHPMCFQSGEEYVRAIVDNTGFMSMIGHKDVESLKRCVLEFSQCVLDGVDPLGDAAKTAALVRGDADNDFAVERHPLWAKAFALQALGHVAVATKPLE